MSDTPCLTLLHRGRRVLEAQVDGRLLPLAPLESVLLGLLAWRPWEPVLREDLMEVMHVTSDVLNTVAYRLRKRLPAPGHLVSLGRHSYILRLQVSWNESADFVQRTFSERSAKALASEPNPAILKSEAIKERRSPVAPGRDARR